MLIRKIVNKRWRLQPGQTAISPEAAPAVFRGWYAGQELTDVRDFDESYDGNGDQVVVVRRDRRKGTTRMVGNSEFSPHYSNAKSIEREMSQPGKLERGQFVEAKSSRIKRGLFLIAALGLSGGVVASGCGDSRGSSSTAQATSTIDRSAGQVPFIFDDLGGGSAVIKVYPGPGEDAADKVANGTYMSGQSAPAECQTIGRQVDSDPTAGEASQSSTMWVRIQGTPGQTEFATLVYSHNPDQLSKLPLC